MSLKTEVIVTDDLTGDILEEHNTHTFGLDGVLYEIDLSDENSDEFTAMVQRYIDAGRKQGASRRFANSRNRNAKKK